MKLTGGQLAQYRQDGYLVFPGLLNDAEVAVLQGDVPTLQSARRGHSDANVMTESGGVRSSYSPGLDSQAFDAVFRLPRILEPVRQLLGGDVYLYQSRLNAKPKADPGATWQWHQDFPSWYHDGIPEPKMMTAMVLVSDCTEENAPLMMIPQVHGRGTLDYFYDTESTEYALNSLPPGTVEALSSESPPVSMTGKAGTVVFFDCLAPHSSGANTSDAPRNLMFYVFNRFDNQVSGDQKRRPHRSPYLLNHDIEKLTPIADNALLTLQEATVA